MVVGGGCIALVVSEVPRSPGSRGETGASLVLATWYTPSKKERKSREKGSPVRWLSTPVIKYDASEGSQHARASAFKDGQYANLLAFSPFLLFS